MPNRLLFALLAVPPLLVAGGLVWLLTAPPDLLRLGTGYSAKIVCSSVFVSERDAGDVLREDVQAPGHPLLRRVDVRVDESAGRVRATLFGFVAPVEAVHRPGLGCTVLPEGRVGFSAVASGEGVSVPDTHPLDSGSLPGAAELLQRPELVGEGIRAALVLHRGRVVAERYADGFSAETPLLGWSMTKTVTAVLVGTLVREGRISLGDTVLFEAWASDERAGITVAHLLGMSSSLAFNEEYGDVTDVTRMLYLEPDMAAFAEGSTLEANPGTRYSYSSGTTLLLSRVWQGRFANPEEAWGWPRSALFAPLGMGSAVLETDASGTFVGSSYLYASARDWARFGQFLLQDGVWEGERLLPEGFTAWMREPAAASDGHFGQGHLWLRGPGRYFPPGERPEEDAIPADAFWLLGHDGQSVAVIPSLEMVVVRLGLTPEGVGYRPQPLVSALSELVASGSSAAR